MFGTRDEFTYWECSTCGCLQIAEIPERLGDYYPRDYYSFALDLPAFDKWLYRVFFRAPSLAPLIRRASRDEFFADQKFQAVVDAKPPRGARILDVGCGSGKLVTVLRNVGYDAVGVDPFLNAPSEYLRKTTFEETEGGWDLIMFHHSLEHMPDHVHVLRTAREKLAPGGKCLVRIPIAAWAWKHYGRDWVQLDAPRHLVIHSPKSFRRAAVLAGFEEPRIIFDSTVFQFYGSELYKRDIPLSQKDPEWAQLSPETLRRDAERATELNRLQQGDQAAFFLTVGKDS